MKTPVSRREFIKKASVVTAGALILPACGELEETIPPKPPIFVEDGKARVLLIDYPELVAVGGASTIRIEGFSATLIAARQSANIMIALSRRCTHQSCSVAYNAGNERFDCPCHGSRFGTDGHVIQGPATRPLTRFDVEFDPADDFFNIVIS